MKNKPVKTNAVRILEKHGISFELRQYDVDESDLSGATVAVKIGLPAPQVFKTLVVKGTMCGIILACIPTDRELDLKALAAFLGDKKIDLIPVKDIQKLTGYIRGGVSPVGTTKPYRIYLDESAFAYPVISLSAGVRGCQMLIAPGDLGKVVETVTCRIAP